MNGEAILQLSKKDRHFARLSCYPNRDVMYVRFSTRFVSSYLTHTRAPARSWYVIRNRRL